MPSPKNLQNILWIFSGFLSLAYLLPTSELPLRSLDQDKLMLLTVLFSVMCLVVAKEFPLLLPTFAVLPVGILLWIAAQLIAGMYAYPSDLLLPAFFIVAFVFALLLGGSLGATPDGALVICDTLAKTHLFAALISSVLATVQVAGIDWTPFVAAIELDEALIRPYANIGQTNQLALLLCIAGFSVWWLFQRCQLGSVMSAVAMLVLIWALALTQSRVGWLIVPTVLFFLTRPMSGERSVGLWFSVGIVATYIAFILALPYLAHLLGLSGGDVSSRLAATAERKVLYQQALAMVATHPWLGVGWAGFGQEQFLIAQDFVAVPYTKNSHNLFLNLSAELGLPAGIAVFIGLIVWFFKSCVRQQQTLPIRFAIAFLVAVFIHSMLEFPLWYGFVLMPVGLLIGMAHVQRWQGAGCFVLHRLSTGIFAAICVVGVLVFSWDFQRVKLGIYASETMSFYEWDTDERMQRPSFTFSPAYFDYLQAITVKPVKDMRAEDVMQVEKVTQRFPFPDLINKLAEVYVLNGRSQDAVRALIAFQRLYAKDYRGTYAYWERKAKMDAAYAQVFNAIPPPASK
jgi:Virulence factor membrane-bound polymerase, C-terminal/O-Antigen ligase